MGSSVHGIVLAAGRSDRAGSPKALATLDGESFVSRASRVLHEGGCSEVWVVVGGRFAQRIREQIIDARVVENPDPDRGMLSSLQVGIAAAFESELPPTAFVFSLLDHPRVSSDIVQKLIANVSETHVVRPCHAGKPGHPVVIGAEAARKLLQLDGRTVVRDAIARIAAFRDIEIDDASVLDDADTRAAIEALGGVPADE